MLLLPHSSHHLLDSRYQQMAVLYCLLCLIGTWISGYSIFPALFWVTWVVVSFLLCAVYLLLRQNQSLLKLSLGFFIFSFSALLGNLNNSVFHQLPNIHSYLEQTHHVEFIFETPTKLDVDTGKATQWRIKIDKIDDHVLKNSFSVLLQLNKTQKQEIIATIGDIAESDMALKEPPQSGIPDGFDYQQFLHLDGIQALGKISSSAALKITGQNNHIIYTVQRLAIQVRDRIVNQFNQALPQQEAHLLGSIVLGEHASPIDDELKNNFRNAGLAHILAASGMNVGLVAAFILWLTTLLKVPFRLKIILCMGATAFYAVMTGLPPSILRAGLMLEIALFLTLLQKELSALLVLNIAAIILTILSPNILQTVSFQLSYLSTFGLIAMTPPLDRWLGFYIGRGLATLLLVPLIAQIWVIPIQLLVFHQLSFTAIPANIIAVPLVALCTYGGFGLGMLSICLPSVGQFLLSWLHIPLVGLEWTSQGFGIGPLANIAVGNTSAWFVFMIYTVLFMLSLFGQDLMSTLRANKSTRQQLICIAKRGLVSACIILSPYTLAKWQNSNQLQVKIFGNKNWGGANSLVQFKNGESVIILTNYGSSSLLNLKSHLSNQGIRHINTLLVPSNPPEHESSRKRLAQLLSALDIDTVYYEQQENRWPELLGSVEAAHRIQPLDFYKPAQLSVQTGESVMVEHHNNNVIKTSILENKTPIIEWLSGYHGGIKQQDMPPKLIITSFVNEPVRFARQTPLKATQAISDTYLDIKTQDNKIFSINNY